LEEVAAGVRLVAELSVCSLARQPYPREALIGHCLPGELGWREAFVRERPVVAERVAKGADGCPLERSQSRVEHGCTLLYVDATRRRTIFVATHVKSQRIFRTISAREPWSRWTGKQGRICVQ